MMLVNFLLGCAMAYFEDWSVEDGYLFMAGSMASLANPVTDVETATSSLESHELMGVSFHGSRKVGGNIILLQAYLELVVDIVNIKQ